MARKNKIPLKQVVMDGPSTDAYGDKDGLLDDLDINFDTQFKGDKMLGLGMNAIQPKGVDNTAIDTQISQIEKPAGGSVYDKMAARYRSQGEGKVLRTQKNLNNLFSPTINLIKEREAAAEARFTLLKDKMPEFDDSTIFGNQSGNEMPIKDYVMGISKSVKEDLRMLSRLNINDERYDEVKKRVEKNQDSIVNFDEINKKLLEIRNSQDGREDHTQWSKGMDQTTIDMWTDIYSSKGENIKIVDGKLVWTDTTGAKSQEIQVKSNALSSISSITETPTDKEDVKKLQKNLVDLGYDISVDGVYGPKTKAAYKKFLNDKESIESEVDSAELEGVGDTKTIDLSQIGEGPTMIDNKGTNMDIALRGETQKFIEMGGKVDDPMYNQMIKSKLSQLNKIGPQGFKSLIFDGIGLEDTDMFTGSNTDSFIEKVIADTYAGGDMSKLSEKEIQGYIQQMKSGDVTLPYNTGEIDPQTGKPVTSSLQSLFMKWYKGEIDDAITEGVKSKVVAPGGGGGNGRNGNNPPVVPKPGTNMKWSDFKTFADTEDFVNNGVDVNIESLGGPGKMTINNDGTYNFDFGEDNKNNAENFTARQAATLLSPEYPNITIDAIEDSLLQKKIGGEYKSDEKYDLDIIRNQKKKRGEGLDISYIAEEIWEPNTPDNYNMGENGKAFFDYLKNNGVGTTEPLSTFIDEESSRWLYFYDAGPNGDKNLVMTYKGESVFIYNVNEDGTTGDEVMNSTGDSTGGNDNLFLPNYDTNDVKGLLKTLGITGY